MGKNNQKEENTAESRKRGKRRLLAAAMSISVLSFAGMKGATMAMRFTTNKILEISEKQIGLSESESPETENPEKISETPGEGETNVFSKQSK